MATKNPRQVATTLLVFLIIVGAGAGLLIWRQKTPGVTATFLQEPRSLGSDTEIALQLGARGGGVRAIRVELLQGEQRVTLAEEEFQGPAVDEREVKLNVDARSLGLAEAEALLMVYARDGLWRLKPIHDEPILRRAVNIDLTAPELSVLAATRYPEQGGAGVVALRSEPDAKVELHFGDDIFPATSMTEEHGTFVALFAVPFDKSVDTALTAHAVDEAGNARTRTVDINLRRKNFARGSVNISTDWLAGKLPELLPGEGTIGPDGYEQAFLKLNNQMRAQAAQIKRDLSRRSGPQLLWDGAFIQPRNTRVFSNFAETRDYKLGGKTVDTQVHFGFDLASVKRASIPAANAGRVIYADELGIYGNTVVLDHGLGLLTLYAHLSELNVTEGDTVEKGDELGRSGTTGLAVGDHLHYEVLVHGIPVTPLQWWDGSWIRDHIGGPMRDAGLEAPAAR